MNGYVSCTFLQILCAVLNKKLLFILIFKLATIIFTNINGTNKNKIEKVLANSIALASKDFNGIRLKEMTYNIAILLQTC